jgi:hypothetical protein
MNEKKLFNELVGMWELLLQKLQKPDHLNLVFLNGGTAGFGVGGFLTSPHRDGRS